MTITKFIRQDECHDDIIYVSTGREILSLFKDFEKRGIAVHPFIDFPKVNMDNMYGLMVSSLDIDGKPYDVDQMSIVTANNILLMICDGILKRSNN